MARRARALPALPPWSQLTQGLIAEWVHSRAGGKRVRDEDMEALHSIWHAPRGHPRDLRDVRRVVRSSVGQVCRVRSGICVGQLRVGRQSGLHLPHEALVLQGADSRGEPGARRVVGRRERRPVGQPGCGPDDVRIPTRAPMGDAQNPSWCPPELAGDCVQICVSRLLPGRQISHGDVVGVTGSMPAVGRSASWTDCQIWPYQGASLLAFGAATEAPDTVGRAASCGSMTV